MRLSMPHLAVSIEDIPAFPACHRNHAQMLLAFSPHYPIVECSWENMALSCLSLSWSHPILRGPGHKGANHVPKAVSDHDPLRDWVCDLNYVRSQALQPPSQSRTGSAHCQIIFCVLLRRLTHAWLQRAFPKCARMNHVPKELCVHKG